MSQEQADLYAYATAEHGNVLPGGAVSDDDPAFSANDVRRMCARVVLGSKRRTNNRTRQRSVEVDVNLHSAQSVLQYRGHYGPNGIDMTLVLPAVLRVSRIRGSPCESRILHASCVLCSPLQSSAALPPKTRLHLLFTY